MKKKALYISDLEVALRKRSDRIVVEKKGEKIAEIRCDELDTVILLGPIEFSTQVVFKLAQHNIELALCTRDGRLVAQLTPPCPANIYRLLKQYDLLRKPCWALASAKNVVAAKLRGCIRLLDDVSKNFGSEKLRDALHKMKERIAGIDSAENLQTLLGIEGAAGELYFSVFGLMVKDVPFPGRHRHPPQDPVNAVLSLCYRLAASELNGLIDAAGLNPALGFYHKPEYGRPSLALDLLEEFRAPLCDRFAIKSFNLGKFKASDFESEENGVRFKPDSFKSFLRSWEEYQMEEFNLDWGVKTWNDAFRASISILSEAVDSGKPYAPIPLEKK
ncbi:MAG: CRISPR-associated endonuclease Cas1 [bacterium]|jgi:CRISPR-associated protein Cas1